MLAELWHYTAPSTEGSYPDICDLPGYTAVSSTVTVVKGGGIPGFELLTLSRSNRSSIPAPQTQTELNTQHKGVLPLFYLFFYLFFSKPF